MISDLEIKLGKALLAGIFTQRETDAILFTCKHGAENWETILKSANKHTDEYNRVHAISEKTSLDALILED